MGDFGVELEANVYNRQVGRDQKKFKVWRSAGLMLSYWCPARCACCYDFSGPNAGEAATEMSVEDALDHWAAIRRLGGERGKVHLTGGEPFGDFERLERILQGACEKRLGGLEKIETNAFWCSNEKLVRERLERLKELGLERLQISTDVYHQEYVPMERVELAFRVAREVLGADGVQVRWRDFYENPVLVGGMDDPGRSEQFLAAYKKRRERLLGRAAAELANLFPLRDYENFADNNCVKSFLGARHVHVDGAGNVFSGTCIGIVVGQVRPREAVALDELWRGFDYRKHPIISVLVDQGPVGLLSIAEELGYVGGRGYASKCHLCYELRRFLYEKGVPGQQLGPGGCYGLNFEKPQVNA